jgi:hypothetical protein
MSSTDLAEQASTWYWQGRQAYLMGQPCKPPAEDQQGAYRAGYAVARQADRRWTGEAEDIPPASDLFG